VLWHVEADAVDGYLAQLYRFVGLHKAMADDADLLTAEALALKAGIRLKEEAKVLERALQKHPDDPRLLAETGLLRAYGVNGEPCRDQAGFDGGLVLLRRAASLRPDDVRYHYYLGRVLQVGILCELATLPEAAAEAIRAFARAAAGKDETREGAVLARTADDKLLSLVLETVNPPEPGDPPVPPSSTVGIPAAELLDMVAAALSRVHFGGGNGAEPRDAYMLLARLQYAAGDGAKAWQALKQRKWRMNNRPYHCESGKPKLRFAARILEEGGYDNVALTQIRAELGKLEQGCRY
jgi:tetratricopeptide (TPR) repeat protein